MDRFSLIPQEIISFVGWSPAMKRVLEGYRQEVGRFQQVAGYFEAGPAPEEGFPSLGPIEEMERTVSARGITLLIADEASLGTERIHTLSVAASRALVYFQMIPSWVDIQSRRVRTRTVAGIPVLSLTGVPLDFLLNRILKRAVDIVGALVGLAISAPLIAVMAALIKAESPGPAFYRQVRVGKEGRLFQIIKLRSMRLDAEAAGGAGWTVSDDPRRLRIGAFIRKWNIDETPQFWNVFKGDMSLVGPRPERPEFVSGFNRNIDHYNLRHHYRPGMTSWAAIHGLRGNTSIEDRLSYDRYYYENWSLPLDFRIMFRTLLPPKNAY